jgi:hypothetical protein
MDNEDKKAFNARNLPNTQMDIVLDPIVSIQHYDESNIVSLQHSIGSSCIMDLTVPIQHYDTYTTV